MSNASAAEFDAMLPAEIEYELCKFNPFNSLKITSSLIGYGSGYRIIYRFTNTSLAAYGDCLYLRVTKCESEVTANVIC